VSFLFFLFFCRRPWRTLFAYLVCINAPGDYRVYSCPFCFFVFFGNPSEHTAHTTKAERSAEGPPHLLFVNPSYHTTHTTQAERRVFFAQAVAKLVSKALGRQALMVVQLVKRRSVLSTLQWLNNTLAPVALLTGGSRAEARANRRASPFSSRFSLRYTSPSVLLSVRRRPLL